MFRCHPLPSYLLLATVILIATRGHGANLCHQDQSAALLRLKAGFHFDTMFPNCSLFPSQLRNLSSWKVDTNCCTWEGVTCDGTSGYVTALDLSDLCISGNLSTSDIIKLTSLRSVSLADNNFDESPWPSPGFEQLADLEYLDLSYSGLSGDVPVEKGQLSNLVTLDLSGLDLKYLSLQTLIDNLDGLQVLHLYDANISVSPADLAHASYKNTTSSLKELYMGRWRISGSRFDTVLANLLFNNKLPNLISLGLFDLDLKYLSLENLIDNLFSLQKLYIDTVNISGSPTDLAHVSYTNTTSGLKELYMWWCTSTITGSHLGTILTTLFRSKLANLVMLELSGFDLKNLSLHALIDSLGNVQRIDLDQVNISVSPKDWAHPASTNTMSGLKELTMRGCTITDGRLDTALTKLPLLSNLVLLDLSGPGLGPQNNLSLDSLIDNLGSLQKLYLYFVNISVSPANLAQTSPTPTNMKSNLKELSMTRCTVTGPAPVPERFVEFSSLTTLSLRSCRFSRATFPSWIFRIKSLMSLDVSGNENLCGELPEFIEGSALQELMVSGTKFSGKIPESISNLRNLTTLDLSYCQFHGLIPSFVQWPMIWSVDLSGNSLTGSLPLDGYLSLHNLTYLYLGNNSMSGVIPASLFSHPSLVYLDLSQNNFTGNFLLYPTISPSLKTIDVSFNKLQGPLPKLLSKFVELYWLDLSSNSINGTVDLSFIKNYKELCGSIPPCLLKHTKGLEILNLRGNKFHGSLPQDISEDCALEIIDLNGNKLVGKLPESLISCRMLQVLDLGNNLIVDTYPEWLGALPSLKVLVLKSNGFHGPIDYSRMNKQTHPFFPELQVLDLSSNSFNGSIPTQFLKQFKAMMVVSSADPSMYVGVIEPASSSSYFGSLNPKKSYFGSTLKTPSSQYRESVTVTLKGHETLVQVLSVFMTLDLSNNNFEGGIPEEIGDLKFLKGLNLSRNSFTGVIPPRIANMLQLESLDLSYNQFSGEIPPAMAAMSFLEVLNLSYNHLSGQILQFGQFLTFLNTSFLGNDWLCGKPLSRLCDEPNHAPSAAAMPGSSKKLNWEFLSVEVGIISGLAVVVVTMLLWGNGRRWVYWHVDKFWLLVLHPWICRRLR
ncbi:unnamed protein product [Urochloa decumbens]|uniref:Leucine-rich repeat-containing N-terminal plant-type domain-containing protein n=1 Tax=Urochloa decumbens TaxID=240449 RepID=A0ABC9BJU2_9POAL